MQKSIGKWEIWPPVKLYPLKISSCNFVHMITLVRLPTIQISVCFFHFKPVQSLNPNLKVDLQLYGSHLEKSMWHHNFAANCLISTRFVGLMQNDMLITTHGSKSKPATEFQFSENPEKSVFNSIIDTYFRLFTLSYKKQNATVVLQLTCLLTVAYCFLLSA